MKITVLDDWAGVAEEVADWAPLRARAEVAILREPRLGAALIDALKDSDVVLPMRERTSFDAATLAALPRLKLIALTGNTTRHLDLPTVAARGITLCWSGTYHPEETAEFALGLILSAEKGIGRGEAAIARGGFMQGTGLGRRLKGLTLGVLGPGHIGGRLARMAHAMEMEVIGWSRGQTPLPGLTRAPFGEVLERSDILSLHLPLNDRTRGLLGAAELARMKPGALLVNTARGPLIREPALIDALQRGHIRAALDVYDTEPLPPDHPLRRLPNVTLTPHLGYATRECMGMFYRDCIENLLAWLDGRPNRVL